MIDNISEISWICDISRIIPISVKPIVRLMFSLAGTVELYRGGRQELHNPIILWDKIQFWVHLYKDI